MDCADARERMLEAEPAELSLHADGELSRHLRECGGCRAIASQILSVTEALDDALSATHSIRDDAAIERFRRGEAGNRGFYAGVAIAAAVVFLLFLYHPLQDVPGVRPVASTSTPADTTPVIEDVGGANLAMFATEDPNITIAWIY